MYVQDYPPASDTLCTPMSRSLTFGVENVLMLCAVVYPLGCQETSGDGVTVSAFA